MAALTNPLNSAECDWDYSVNSGGAYTPFGTEIVNVVPTGFKRKVLERRLLNVTRVQKYLARIDYGELKFTCEYSSATFTTVFGWQTSKTAVWLRVQPEDTGGGGDSSIIFKSSAFGGIFDVVPFSTPGDDEIMTFEFTMAVDDATFAAGS